AARSRALRPDRLDPRPLPALRHRCQRHRRRGRGDRTRPPDPASARSRMTDEAKNIPVAIAGGGPVGLMLALYLDLYGVKSVVFNTEADVRHHPKGSTHNSRTMEHHRQLGIAPRIRDLCLPINRPTDVSYYTRLTGWELSR